jgi:hypothetical protein
MRNAGSREELGILKEETPGYEGPVKVDCRPLVVYLSRGVT